MSGVDFLQHASRKVVSAVMAVSIFAGDDWCRFSSACTSRNVIAAVMAVSFF